MGSCGVKHQASGIVPALDPYLETRLAACHPLILEWQGRAKTREFLERWLKGYLVWLRDDEAVLEKYAAACPVDGATSAEYGVRSIQLGGFGSVFAGIHFYGSAVKRPFVHVTATDFELKASCVKPLTNLLQDEFAVFQPERWRIWLDDVDGPLAKWPGAVVDNWFLAGRRDEIRKRAVLDHQSRITLVAEPNLESYADFERCYREFNESNPGTDEWNSAVDREVLEDAAREGGNFRVHIDGEPAGWIAARMKGDGFLSGWSMADELLEAKFRGQGLAAAMQRTFLEALPAGEELIWGTIDPRNAPSLATARRVGREIVCGYLFLPFL